MKFCRVTLCVLLISQLLAAHAYAADIYEAAVAHPGRPAADLKRDALDHPAEILRLAGIRPGMRVVDVLAGDGYYSELLGYLVGPSGQVLLLNNAAFDNFSDGLAPRLASRRVTNVTRSTVDLNDMHLPAASFDAVLLIKVYHDLYWVDSTEEWPKIDVGAVLDQLAHALKKGGQLVLVDHSAQAGHGADDASTLHRIEEQYAIKDLTAHGFRLEKRSDVLRKPDDPRDAVSYKGPMLGKTDRFVLIFRKT